MGKADAAAAAAAREAAARAESGRAEAKVVRVNAEATAEVGCNPMY